MNISNNNTLNSTIVYSYLKKFISLESDIAENNNIKQVPKNIYIKDCLLDFDKKNIYGLVYELINENFGIYFKDGTQIIYIPNKNKFCYINRKEKKIFNAFSDISKFDNYLKIKIEIMNFFYNNILGKNQELFQINENSIEEDFTSDNNDLLNEKKEENEYLKISNTSLHISSISNINTESMHFLSGKENIIKNLSNEADKEELEDYENTIIYAKKYYILDDKSIIFILNNNLVQIFFFNGNIMLFDNKNKQAKLIKKNIDILEKTIFNFNEISQLGNGEIKNYFIYAKSSFEKIQKVKGCYLHKNVFTSNEDTFFLSSSNISTWKYQILNDSNGTFYGLNSLKSLSSIRNISSSKSSKQSFKDLISKMQISDKIK